MAPLMMLALLLPAVLADDAGFHEDAAGSTGHCALQKTTTRRLAAVVAREEAEAPSGVEDRKHQLSDKHFRMCILLAVLGVTFGPKLLAPLAEALSSWRQSMQSLGTVAGLPPSQRYCNQEVERTFSNWFDVIPKTHRPFIREVGGRQPLTFAELHAFAQTQEVWLSRFGIGTTDRVCTMIPNGPEAAVCFLVFPLRCVFAPLNPACTLPEIEFEFQDLPCHTVVVMEGEDNAATLLVASQQDVQVLEMEADSRTAGLFTLGIHPQSKVSHDRAVPAEEIRSSRQDVALVLHTSGTTKKPKIVPLTHENLTVGALCIATTLQRETEDVCLNLMPLYHIHGLSVNVLASAMAGASVICTPGYKGPDKPVEWLASGSASWYSAVPTMHQGIVEAALASQDFTAGGAGVGLIRNCSAALVPVLAQKMERLFRCVVMPTYAMSESMPIASNPLPPHLRVLRSVGQAAGPCMTLRHEATNSEPKLGEEAEICVQGACVTKGYEMRAHMDQDPNIEAFTGDGWLRTGDKGYIDEHGYLCLSGRYKEIINRGGEKISPFEVENVCRQWPPVFDCIAFSCPHVQLGETVGLALVLRDGEAMTTGRLEEIRVFAKEKMSEKWLPQCLLFMKDIPKGSTGKPARIGLAKRMKLEPLDAGIDQVAVWDASSGVPVAVGGGPSAAATSTRTTTDSLGKVREMSEEQFGEMALIESLYGFAIPWVIYFHCHELFVPELMSLGHKAISGTYTYPFATVSEHMAPFAYEYDVHHLGSKLAFNMRPVTVFLVCQGYLEVAERHFTFGGFRREITLGVLCVLLALDLPSPLFVTFLEAVSGNHSLAGVSDEIAPVGFMRGPWWFLDFLLVGRVLLVLCHKAGIPGWLQILCAVTASVYAPVYPKEPRASPGPLLFAYAVLASGTHVAPPAVRLVARSWRSATRGGRLLLRGCALAYLAASFFGPAAFSFSDACRMRCLAQDLMPKALCAPLNLADQVLWVGAVAVCLAPGSSVLQLLGHFALGAYLLGFYAFLYVCYNDVSILGVVVFPSMARWAQIFLDERHSIGFTLSYTALFLTVIALTSLMAGFCFHSVVAGLVKFAKALKPAIGSKS